MRKNDAHPAWKVDSQPVPLGSAARSIPSDYDTLAYSIERALLYRGPEAVFEFMKGVLISLWVTWC